MGTIRQYSNNNFVITEDSGKEIILPSGITPTKEGDNIVWLNANLDVVKNTPAASITEVTDQNGVVTTINDVDDLFNALRDSFFFRVGGAGGTAFVIRNTHIFADNAARDTYFDTPDPHLDELIQGQTLIAVGAGFQRWDGPTNPATYVNTNWTDVTAVIRGPQGATGGVGPTGPTGPQGPAGEQFNDVEITANLTINVANLATYENTNVVNVSSGIGQITVTMDTIANFLASDPTDEFIIRFINESAPSTMVIVPGTGNFFAQVAGNVTLNQGQSLEIKLPQAGTRWSIINESASAAGGITPPPTTPTALPSGNVEIEGNWDPTTGSFPSGASQGDIYIIVNPGTVDGRDFFRGDFIISEVANPSTTTFDGNWGNIPAKGSVHSLFGRQGVIGDAFMISNLDRLGYVRNSGVVNPSFHEFVITTIPTRVDLNTDLNGTQTIQFSVTNHGDVASATVQADPVTVDTFIDIATITVPSIDGTQTQTLTFAGLTSDTEKTISFRIRAVDAQGSVHLSNEYDVEVRTLTTQEQAHFGFIQSTEDVNDIDFTADDIEARNNFAGSWTVSGIPSDSNLYRIYMAVPVSEGSVSQVIQTGFNITNQFANNGNITISGNNYNVFLMNVAAAVNSNYNGSILQFS